MARVIQMPSTYLDGVTYRSFSLHVFVHPYHLRRLTCPTNHADSSNPQPIPRRPLSNNISRISLPLRDVHTGPLRDHPQRGLGAEKDDEEDPEVVRPDRIAFWVVSRRHHLVPCVDDGGGSNDHIVIVDIKTTTTKKNTPATTLTITITTTTNATTTTTTTKQQGT